MGEGPEVVSFEAASTPVEAGRGVVSSPRPGARYAAAGTTWSAPLGLSLVGWLAVASLAVGIALRVWPVGGVAGDYDEGVYWQSLRAMSEGHALYSSIFSSQPPFFLVSAYPFYLLFGQSLIAARLGMVVYSLIGMGAAYVAARGLGGRLAATLVLVLLALDPLFLQESRTLQAEAPAMSFELGALALSVLAMRAAGTRRLALAGASGLVLALGSGVKLSDVVGVVPVALYLLSPVGAVLLEARGMPSWPGGGRFMRAVREAAPTLLACAVGGLIGAAIVVLPFLGQWPAMYDQAVRFHLVAAHTSDQGLRANMGIIAGVSQEVPLEVLALALIVVALARRQWVIVPPALWVGASFLFLLVQHPLQLHHIAVLVPPLALTVAIAVPALLDATAWQGDGRARPRGVSATTLAAGNTWALVIPVALVALVVAWSTGSAYSQTRPAAGAPVLQSVVAAALANATEPGDLVVADDQYIAGLADRNVPPSLVDTSYVRISSGYLTAHQLEQIAQQPNVRAVLFYSKRFDLVPGFRAWVEQHFTLARTFGGDTALYVKVPHGPQTA